MTVLMVADEFIAILYTLIKQLNFSTLVVNNDIILNLSILGENVMNEKNKAEAGKRRSPHLGFNGKLGSALSQDIVQQDHRLIFANTYPLILAVVLLFA